MDIARPDLARRKSTRRRRLVVAGTLTAVVLLAVAAIVIGNAPPSIPHEGVLVDTVRRGTFVRSVRGAGKLVPSQTRLAVARVEGSVDRILLRAGSMVEADTVILALVNPAVEERLQTAQAAFAAAESDHLALRAGLQSEMFTLESDLVALRGELASSKIQAQAGQRGFDLGVLSRVELQRMKVMVSQLGERVALAEKRVDQFASNMQAQTGASAARLAQLESAAERRSAEAASLQVRAGMDGILQRVEVEEGQRVDAGESLARVAKPEGLIAELFIPELQAGQLAAGLPASIRIGNREITGRTLRVDPAISRGAVRVEVALTAALPAGARPEQSIEGTVVLGEIPDALFVGVPVDTAPDSTSHVYRLVDADTAERTPVRFGPASMTQVQVLSGLEAGDRIVLSQTGHLANAPRIVLD